jgi:hypothetical protein
MRVYEKSFKSSSYLTLLCFTDSGFCSVSGGIIGAVVGGE